MAHKKYEDIRLVPAKGGYILKYCVKSDGPADRSGFVNTTYEPTEEVFTKDNLNQAIAKMEMMNEESSE